MWLHRCHIEEDKIPYYKYTFPTKALAPQPRNACIIIRSCEHASDSNFFSVIYATYSRYITFCTEASFSPTMHKREEKICSNIYCHVNIRSHVTMLYTIDDNKFGRCFKQKSKAKPCMGHPNKISVGLHFCRSSLYF